MRIVFLGNFRPEFSSENDWLKSLRILGCDVWTCQEDEVDAAGVSGAIDIRRPDVFIWVHTNGWPLLGRSRFWVETLGVPSVMLTLDLYRGLEREQDVDELPNFRCKYVYTADEPDWLRSRGVNAFFSPPGILETSAYLAAPDPLHPAYNKIAFVGSRNYHKAWPWRQQLLALLEKTYGDRFMFFDHSSGMRGHALNVLYASAAVVVGDSCFASPESRYTSDRFYESAGRGAVLVYPEVSGLSSSMHPGGEAMCWFYEPGNERSFLEAVDDARYETIGRVRDINSYDLEKWRYENSYTARLRKILAEVGA